MTTEVLHPDSQWLAEVAAAIEAWLAAPSTSPTSQITGGGAVRAAEDRFSGLHGGRPALLVPSATYGMRVALQTLGIGPGDGVLIPGLDWPSTYAAVKSLGAVPRPVAVEPTTLTIDPAAAKAALVPGVKAVVACHLHGIPADIPALAKALPDVPIIEDCAQAFGATLDGLPVGCLGDLAVFSAGPNKTLEAGEAGVILTRTHSLMDAAHSMASHPVRQLIQGRDQPEAGNLSIRVHPLAAILLWHTVRTAPVRASLAAIDARRSTPAIWIPEGLATGKDLPLAGFTSIDSGAWIINDHGCRPSDPPIRLRQRGEPVPPPS